MTTIKIGETEFYHDDSGNVTIVTDDFDQLTVPFADLGAFVMQAPLECWDAVPISTTVSPDGPCWGAIIAALGHREER